MISEFTVFSLSLKFHVIFRVGYVPAMFAHVAKKKKKKGKD